MDMHLETLLRQSRNEIKPSAALKKRLKMRMQDQIKAPAVLLAAREAVEIDAQAKTLIWQRVLDSLGEVKSAPLLNTVRTWFAPSSDLKQALRTHVLSRLSPQPTFSFVPTFTFYKWTAAVAVFALLVQMAPAVFWATPTVADSSVSILPTGDVYIHGINTLDPLYAEQRMEKPLRLKTGVQGAVTVAAFDDYLVRLDSESDVEWHDITDRPEPVLDGSTITLWQGRMWLQGLLPQHVRGVTVTTPAGEILMHRGSIDIAARGATVTVRVLSNNAEITHNGRTLTLSAGEQTQLTPRNLPSVSRLRQQDYKDDWVVQNLSRDAVHRKDIAQWQRERRVAEAGILPTSPFYGVKRAVERASELTAFSEHSKVKQKLGHAKNRLNEAAALLEDGEHEEAEASLEEYKSVLLALATESDASSVTDFLLRQEIAENTAELSAVAADDESYVLKKVALEAGAALPTEILEQDEVEEILLVDAFDLLKQALQDEDFGLAISLYKEMRPTILDLADNQDIAPVVKKEGQSILRNFAQAILDDKHIVITAEMTQELEAYLPQTGSTYVPLSSAQIARVIGEALDRIYVYGSNRGKLNQLFIELTALRGHADESRILQQLYENIRSDEAVAGEVRYRLRELSRVRQKKARAQGSGEALL